jgi:hypothetical protein
MKYLVIETDKPTVPEIFSPLYIGDSLRKARQSLLSADADSVGLFEWYELGQHYVIKSAIGMHLQ